VAHAVRTTGPTRLASGAALALLVIAGPRAATQAQQTSYAALVAQYARGGADAQAAALALAKLPQATATAMIARDGPALPRPLQRAAVMLHTDTAYAEFLAGVTGSGLSQIGAARRVFAEMKNAGRGDARTQEFERRWFACIATILTSNSLIDRAALMIRDGLTIYPREARLYLARGALQEMRIQLASVDSKSSNRVARRDRAVEIAAADYRRAIELDPLLTPAHLHLGWIRISQDDARARENLNTALAVAATPIDRYLAHLLIGGLAERESRLDDALRDYEAARTIGPACQTPYIALARVETALGNTSRAHEIAVALSTVTSRTEDPWWNFQVGGVDDESLRWLRQEATPS
jgi:tetratricopeptide (TPR) repeat protein